MLGRSFSLSYPFALSLREKRVAFMCVCARSNRKEFIVCIQDEGDREADGGGGEKERESLNTGWKIKVVRKIGALFLGPLLLS